MAPYSGPRRDGASRRREDLFCHACRNEWYRNDRQSMQCLRCLNEITEVVSPDDDPRDFCNGLWLAERHSSESRALPEHHGAPVTMDGISVHHFTFRQLGDSDRLHRRGRPNPSRDADLRRLTNMLRDDLLRDLTDPVRLNDVDPPVDIPNLFPTPGLRCVITWDAGPRDRYTRLVMSPNASASSRLMGHADLVLASMAIDVTPNHFPAPRGLHATRGLGSASRGTPQQRESILATGLQRTARTPPTSETLNSDAVYSEEAVQRIAATLMDASYESTATSPVSERAKKTLKRSRITDAMLRSKGKLECAICITEMRIGDDVLVLPCRHLFHCECVATWFEEHNTLSDMQKSNLKQTIHSCLCGYPILLLFSSRSTSTR